MTRGAFLMCGLLVVSWAGLLPASAANEGNPYQAIVVRNAFGLKPPPPPVDPNEIAKAPPGKITLTGITTILGNKRALMKVAVPAKPPAPPREDSFILAEGQRDGDVEVLEIDEGVGSVKVNNAGVVMTLTFDKDGAKLNPAANPVTPGIIPPPGSIPPPPMGGLAPNPGNGANFNNGMGMRTIPPRTRRMPSSGDDQGSAITPDGSMAFPNGNPQAGMAYPNGTANAQPTSQLSADERQILMEANRLKYQNQGSPLSRLIPPTRFGQVLQNQQNGQP